MQISDTLLSSLDVRVEPFAVCDVRDGAYLDIPADTICSIHYVLFGNGTLTTHQGDPISLVQDQVVLIPSGIPQRISSSGEQNLPERAASICLQPSESIKWLKSAGSDTNIILACGHIHATYGQEFDIFSLLDQPLVESFDQSSYIRGAFEAILHEFCQPQLGTIALTSTLMKQCLILLLRRLYEQQDQRVPWLAVLDKRGLQKALKAILESPEQQYRVEDLAEIAAMSRSAFTEQFTKTLGQPPHEFLSNYRLRRAAQLLSTTDMPVKTIASEIGFKSRSSFSRAFKSLYNVDPAGFRQSR